MFFAAQNFNRNVTVPWWETQILNADNHAVEETLRMLGDASFIVLNAEMYKLLNVTGYADTKTVEKLFIFPPGPPFADRMVHDGTVYSPECNCIYFAELHPPKPGFSTDAVPWVWRVNLNGSAPVTEKVYPKPQLTVPNGAYYHDGSVYWAQEGNYTHPGGIVRMNPLTLETEVVLNNFLGHRFNSPNDVVITRGRVAFFTDGYYGFDNFNDTLKPELANGIWRWDMSSGDVRMVAGEGTGIWLNPNGVALNKAEDKLYATARGKTSDDAAGQRTIYVFDIATPNALGPRLRDGMPLAYVDTGFPDGIKLDAEGRIYGGVTGGVDVYSPQGELLGKIKIDKGDVAVNMQWVGDRLYIAARDALYRVQLGCTSVQHYP
ncbi:hypothetical protein N5P37_004334 [Trichoderma harzianum]|uniref:SMP-30/Gluconolactonase/LRE-like region domain-containing protein n=1 Tax=Trichoderma harzianum CBS 226.95 TaxID=983964 RepID=A0A2T3ZRQ1_TRIHA|nr:hypothetical protein M431DRAFT_488545 [Trichoderma harzianum CBS 226.95]KAK0763347.1 hypothetical protein N5P37_004334 [Trichoderma harzianum]PTB47490.1 hypothetical protein M431DRAFT_488545 [Trichoderma harzianum CBS 226.95]